MKIKVLASGSKGNAYYVSDGKTPLLIECGIGIEALQEKLNYGLSKIQGCLISHAHQDHCKAVPQLLKRGIDCYSPMGIEHHRHHNIYHGCMFPIGSWIVKCFDAIHDVPCLGFLLASGNEKLLYLSDSAYSPYRFEGLTHIMVGCNYDLDLLNESIERGAVDRAAKTRIMHSHASLKTIKEMLEANDLSRVQEIYLLHLSERNADPEQFKREIQELTGKVVVC